MLSIIQEDLVILDTLTTIPKEKISDAFSIGPWACASGLRHIQLPS